MIQLRILTLKLLNWLIFCYLVLDINLKYANFSVKNHYWYQMYLDDLPIWGIVGEMDEKDFYIWTHKKFEIGYNGQQIIDVNLTSEGRTKLQLGDSVSFSYEVVWKKSTTNFEVRIWERRFSERFGI